MASPRSTPQSHDRVRAHAAAGAEDIHGLRINYGGCSLPNVLSHVYKYLPFERTMTIKVDGEEQKIVVADKIKPAWSLVWKRADYAPCNAYFKTLVRRKTLKDILQEGITLHLLEPKDGKSYDKLPAANSAGNDIGINPSFLLDSNSGPLACTLIHELAHVAGATTNTLDDDAGAAEMALKHCLCEKERVEGLKG